MHITDNPTNAVFNLQGTDRRDARRTSSRSATTRRRRNIIGLAPVVNGIDFGELALNLSGSVANTGIAGQGTSSGIAVPGGLVRANSATNGHAQPYDPVYDVAHRLAVSSVTRQPLREGRRRDPR